MKDNRWRQGTISVPVENDKAEIYHYRVKVDKEPSELGINGGKVSELIVTLKSQPVIAYYRGWIVEPDPENQKVMAVYSILTMDN